MRLDGFSSHRLNLRAQRLRILRKRLRLQRRSHHALLLIFWNNLFRLKKRSLVTGLVECHHGMRTLTPVGFVILCNQDGLYSFVRVSHFGFIILCGNLP